MSASDKSKERRGACGLCLRRSWLLSALGGPLDYCARDRSRLLELLALSDERLLAAVAGRRKAELEAAYARFDAAELERDAREQTICRHRRDYPHALHGRSSPHMLTVRGSAGRLAKLAAAPAVAILGSAAPSDYGRETARSLARGLAASGVTVVAALSDGIAAAAQVGALEAGAASVAVLSGGLDVSCPPRRRPLYERIGRDGCLVSELPPDCAGRRWGQRASERIIVELAPISVIVEAEQTPRGMAAAMTARELGRRVAAIPGRVTSPLSHGTNALLMDGASLVRGPRDVLELLFELSDARPKGRPCGALAAGAVRPVRLRPTLARVLDRVGAGYDTPDKLTRAGVDARQVLPALTELELTGLLSRGDGGRYLPREPLD